MGEYVLEMSGISKQFPGVKALDEVDFLLRPGEIHALLGENGAGKSTLIKTMTGVHQPDSGQIVLEGTPVTFDGPLSAQVRGIAAIYQDPTVFPALSVAENVFMGHPILHPVTQRINWKAMYTETTRLLAELQVDISPRTEMSLLNVAERQLVEIAKALSLNSQILIMDEPTSALTLQEANRLFTIMRRLRKQGVAIIFISHRLDEVFQIADRVTVLRDGQYIASHDVAQVSTPQLIKLMVGRSLHDLFPKTTVDQGEQVLRVEHLTRDGEFADISLELHRGEILGIAGLVGAGRTEVAQTLFGITSPDSGIVWVNGKPVRIDSPQGALRHGIAYLPEDRQGYGLVLPMDVTRNISLTTLSRFRWGLLNVRREEEVATKYVELLDVRTPSLHQLVKNLSGGNQQKLVLAKWLATNPQILILDEPTKGIDVQAKAGVHRLVGQLAAQGLGIIMISSELPEVLGMSDRILVMHEGRISGRFEREEADQERILAAAIGQTEVSA